MKTKKSKKGVKSNKSLRRTSGGARAAKPKPAVRRGSRGSPVARGPKPATTGRSAKASLKRSAKSAAKLAASVISRRAARALQADLTPMLSVPASTVLPRVSAPTKPRNHRVSPAKASKTAAGASAARRSVRMTQFTYMKAPGADSGFDVGDTVEVYCDHEQDSERVRGWISGVVVQVDNKLVAVQFRSNVFLTDGWMVPDRILWYSVSSDQIRASSLGRRAARRATADY